MSFLVFLQFSVFVLLSQYICNMNTSCQMRSSKSCSYDFLKDFVGSVARQMLFPKCRNVAGCQSTLFIAM
jgi:hypothetical protein